MERYRITQDASVYYITWSIVEWLPVFISEQACRIITDSFQFCHNHKGLRVNAFVIMPTHLHAIVFDQSFRAAPLEETLTDCRKFTGKALANIVDQSSPKCFGQVLRDASGGDRERRFWQPSRHPVAILDERFYLQKLNYLHSNPVRKGLVIRGRDWRFSSAAWFDSDKQASSEVSLSPLLWT